MTIPTVRRLIGRTCCAVALAACATPAPSWERDGSEPRQPSASASPASVELSAQTRRLLCERMKRHGGEMTSLMSAVTMLEWDEVQRGSTRLIEEPTLAWPLPGAADDSYNTRLPASFFPHQEALVAAAGVLREAAVQRSDHELKVAFNGVAQACIDCHAAFLRARERPDLFLLPGSVRKSGC